MKKLEKIKEIKGKRFLFEVETSAEADDYLKYEELRLEIWGDPNDKLAGKRNMASENFFNVGNNLFIALYAENKEGKFKEDKENFIGFSQGFVGVRDKEVAFRKADNILYYSQYAAVRKDFENYGLGILIKEFQREKLMEIFGIYTVISTYDPLTGINAYRNIHHFGMEVAEYKEACYGDFAGNLNRVDVPCDRFLVFWDLKKEVKRPEYDLEFLLDSGNLALSSEMVEVIGRSGPLRLDVAKEMNLDLNSEFLLIEIPYNFYLMLKETNVPQKKVRNIPLDWRMKTREAFQTLFERKYKIVDFRYLKRENRKRDFYVLKR